MPEFWIQLAQGSLPLYLAQVKTEEARRADSDAEAESPRKRIKEMEVMVADVITETPDTTTLVLFTGNDRLDYRAGHFLTLDPHHFTALERFTSFLEDQKGKREPPRAYSLTSAPHEKHIAITIKEEQYVSGVTRYPPLLSPLLVRRTPRGTRMPIIGFTGPYVLPDDIEARTDHLVHLVAGSGSVPNFAILKDSLHTGRKLRHTFIYSNKTWEDVAFRSSLDELKAKYPERLTVVHTLTRQADPSVFGSKVRAGRVTLELLREFIPDPDSAIVYVCGPAISVWDKKTAAAKGEKPPQRFMEHSIELLHKLGVSSDRIKRESYG
jgi:3-ketosteroid 9alpha-monooxygenase subunit B